MTWTYSGDPNASSRDFIRAKTGDVVDVGALSNTDEEIAGFLLEYGDKLTAALAAAQLRKAKAVLITSGAPQASNRGDLMRQLEDICNDIAAQLPASAVAGGVESADVEAQDDDDSLVSQPFKVGREDIPGGADAI